MEFEGVGPEGPRARLYGFATGQWQLAPEHQSWLRQHVLPVVSRGSPVNLRLMGYASKLGPTALNEHLSIQRATAVKRFIEQQARSTITIDIGGYGESRSQGVAENSPVYRAVDVYIYETPKPPPVPQVPPEIPCSDTGFDLSFRQFLPAPTDWRFVNSSGGEISVGLAEFLSVGATIGQLYVREGDGPVSRLQYGALKGGVGVGLSVLGPISASFSPASFEGGGIGRIYKGPTAGCRLSIDDMLGWFLMVTFGINFVPASTAVSVIFMGLPVPPVGSALRSAVVFAKAAGVFWDMSANSSGGLEYNGTTGRIVRHVT
jgi:hypothetical protein